MRQFEKGRYKTWAGYDATIARIRQAAGDFVLDGAVTDPKTGALVMTMWHLSGHSHVSQDLNLVHPESLLGVGDNGPR